MPSRRHVDMPPRRDGNGRDQNGGGSGSGGGGGGRRRIAQGLVVRVTPLGVVTCRVPSGSIANSQPLNSVFSRWWVRHRQHRFVQVVSPPWACGTTWSWSAQPAARPQNGIRQDRSRVVTSSRCLRVGV